MMVPQSEMSITIAQASFEDLHSIFELEQAAFSAPWSMKSIEAEIQGNEFSVVLVARPQGSAIDGPILIGYICFWLVFEELRFLNLAVTGNWRRRGVASHLVSHAIQLGVSRGTLRGLLEVRESNKPAQELYEKFGFSQYAKRKSYYTNPDEDAILMSLDPLRDPVFNITKHTGSCA